MGSQGEIIRLKHTESAHDTKTAKISYCLYEKMLNDARLNTNTNHPIPIKIT